MMDRNCPHCGAELHEDASFCPYCAQSVRTKTEPGMPHPIPRKFCKLAVLALLLLAAVLLVFQLTRPKTYDGLGEVIYTDQDGTYQLVFAHPSAPTEAVPDFWDEEELGGQFRFPSVVFVNHVESGVNAAPAFRKKVASVSAEILQDQDLENPMSCSAPEPMLDYMPDAAWISLVDFISQDMETQFLWTITMKNGDVIRVRQNCHIKAIPVREYRPEDVAMDTIEELRDLLEQIDEEAGAEDVVRIYLPPVRYTGELEISGRPVNLIGSDAPDGSRTTFTGTVSMNSGGGSLPQFEHIDFEGSGNGVGVAASRNLHIYDCRFSHWKTAVLAYGHAWVNVRSSLFAENKTGFYFNSEGMRATHTRYDGNEFRNNEAAILLERVPTDLSISFDDNHFEGNEIDIDNRCGHDVDISKATFR